MSDCKCRGFKFFWGSEIRGYRGSLVDRLKCRACCKLSFWERLRYWWRNYLTNDQIYGKEKLN